MGTLDVTRTRDWEKTFEAWCRPPGQTEQERCDRALAAVRRAIDNSHALAGRGVTVFPQGSYANRTNVRQDSDVDVCVLSDNTYYYDLPPDVTFQGIGGVPATYGYEQYKNELEAALVAHFGRRHVTRGNKAFDIHENTYRVDADAVACFEYRLYYWGFDRQLRYHTGTALLTDREKRRVTNFPQQQYDNGVDKNKATSMRFKPLVRIIKNLRNEMEAEGHAVAEPIASFLIESLVWNWPSELFERFTTWRGMVKAVLAWIYFNTMTEAGCQAWTEENGIKRLFGPHNDWTRQQVNAFAVAAGAYIGV